MTIIGVMPKGFGFPLRQEIWIPLRFDLSTMPRGSDMPLQVFGRLKDGISLREAEADLRVIARRLASEYPATNKGLTAAVAPYTQAYTEDLQPSLYTMLGAVVGLLLIACANTAMLLLVRLMGRSQEVAVRAALGASRWRIGLQFMTEALMLAVGGAILGLAIARVCIDLYLYAVGGAMRSFWMDIRLDPEILLGVVGVILLVTLLSGVIPALQAARLNTNTILKDESRGASSLRLMKLSRLLVVIEITLSCSLLVATGLLVRSVLNLQSIDLGFKADNVFTARISLSHKKYPDPQSRRRFQEELLQRLEGLPGSATSVALLVAAPGRPHLPRLI